MNTQDTAIKAIRELVGPAGWIDDDDGKEPYLKESRGLFRGDCTAVVRPASTAETAEVVRLCGQAGIPITPQGGNTGHVGGGVPSGGIILCTGRMNRIRDIDALNHTMTVEAGCILANLQDPSALVAPTFSWSVAGNAEVGVGAYMGLGKRPDVEVETYVIPGVGETEVEIPVLESEFGLYPVMGFAQMRAYF